ncbi:MAG: rod shape-determining protein MreD [Candidatus Pelethousia sp.]|nr:rod shape-determining protein MreD [Candidatus Pelethousia sp.]
MLYRAPVVLSLLVAIFLDSVLFARLNIMGIRPDCLLALTVSLGVLLGQQEGMLVGLLGGLLTDVLFGRAVGLGAMAYMFAGAAGGAFYKKFYADNVIIPSVTAAACALAKEHLMAVAVRLQGGSFGYFEMLFAYMLPCALLTGGLCALMHLLLKPALQRQVKKHYDRNAGGIR